MEMEIRKVQLNDPKPYIRNCKCGSGATLYTRDLTSRNSFIVICDEGINCRAKDKMEFMGGMEDALREWNLNGDNTEFVANCPFCKDGEAHSHIAGDEWSIRCSSCGARTASFGSKEAAKRAWNRRLGEPVFERGQNVDWVASELIRIARKINEDISKIEQN